MLSIIINRYQSCLVISSWKRNLVKKEMNFKLLLLACIAASIAVTQISAQCLCDSQAHDGGQDVCVTCSRVVRPTPVSRGRIQSRSSSNSNLQQFSAVGDRCSCGNTVVEPAIRPPCRCNQRKGARTSSIASERLSTASGLSSITSDSSSDCEHTRVPFDSANIYAARDSSNTIQKEYSSLLPADPISVSLAYKAAHRKTISVPEEKLSFGFKRIPANAASKKPVPNIPEEKLFTFDRSVVELQDTTCHQKRKKIEEEEEEEDEEDEEEEAKPGCGGLGYLNYKQLGYYPQKHIDNRFDIATTHLDIQSESSPSIINAEESLLEIGNCGYKPGRIVDMSNQASTQRECFNNKGLDISNRGSNQRDSFNNEGLDIIDEGRTLRDYFNNEGLDIINRGSSQRDSFNNEGLDIIDEGRTLRDYFNNERLDSINQAGPQRDYFNDDGVDISNRGSSQRDYFNNEGLEFNLERFV